MAPRKKKNESPAPKNEANAYIAGPVAGAAVGAGSSTLIGQTLENCTGVQQRSAVEIAKNSVVDATIGPFIWVFIE